MKYPIPVLKSVLAVAVLCSVARLWAYRPAVDSSGSLRLAIEGFEQDVSDRAKLRVAKYPCDKPLGFSVTLANTGDSPVRDTLKTWLNDDWQVDVEAAEIELAPHSTQTVRRVATAGARVLAALYPVHATFGALHPIGIFESTGPRAAWKAVPPRKLDFQAASAPGRVAKTFRLAARGEEFDAVVSPGAKGVVDGTIRFVPVCAGRSAGTTLHGFDMEVALDANLPEVKDFSLVDVSAFADRLEVVHALDLAGSTLKLRATFSAEKGALKLAWDMPGASRDAAGLPRYSRLFPGPADEAPKRVFAGFGNVIVDPRRFSLACRGFEVSTRHAGAEYPNGFALVQATRLGADRLECDRASRRFGYAAHHDNTFYFLPSATSAFRAARNWRDVNGFAKSPGHDRLVGRICLDEWGGAYAHAAQGLRRLARYGVTDAVFVKHCWQRWGYDYRLPEIYPPSGDADAFNDMAAACRENGILFCPHDNYIDLYPDAGNYSYDLVIFNSDGTPQKAWFNHGAAALSYRWLPHAFSPWLERNCRLIAGGPGADGLFIDVFTAGHGVDYLDRNGTFYPKMRTSAEWGAAFDNARRWLGVEDGPMISEAGDDHLVGHVDAGQSDHMAAWRWMDPKSYADSERTPWHDMGTHGRMILFAGGLGARYAALNWSKGGDLALHGYGSDDYLSNTILGGRNPMCGGTFERAVVMTYWLQHDLLRLFATAEFEDLEYADGDIHRQHETFSDGGEAWVNRSTNSTWRVAGVELPPYGYFARDGEVESAIALKDGRRCAWARAPGVLFVDARPIHDAMKGPRLDAVEGQARVVDGLYTLPVEWRTLSALPPKRWKGFVHVIAKGEKGERIVRHGGFDGLGDNLSRPCTFKTTLKVDVKGLDLSKYDVYYGIFNLDDHGRAAVMGCDARSRRRVGSRETGVSAAERYAQLGVNADGRRIDFGAIRTNGALKFECDGDRRGFFGRLFGRAVRARVTALPSSRPFDVEIDLAALGFGNDAQVVETTPAADFTGTGGTCSFRYDPAVEAYEFTIK